MMMEIKWTDKPKKVTNTFARSMRLTTGLLPQAIDRPAWGIDPGVNFGLTVIEGKKVWLFHGSLISDPTPGRQGLISYGFLLEVIESFQDVHSGDPNLVIEGAAYGAPFRQVELSEIRTGFYISAGVDPRGVIQNVYIKPPKNIRKAVTGNGKTQAMDEYPTLNHNAADSLFMAIYATQEID